MILAHWLASGPDPFDPNLAQSTRTKSDQGWFCIILSGTSVEEGNRAWKWETSSRPVASCQKPGPMIPAHRLVFRPDECSQTLTKPSRSDPGRFCTVWSMPSLEKTELKRKREVGSGIYDPARFWLHDGRNGRNQNASGWDPAYLLGTVSMFDWMWTQCPGHDREDTLAGNATITSGLRLGRSEVLRSLRHYLLAQSRGHHAIDHLEETGAEKGTLNNIPLKGWKREPSSIRRTLEPFERQRWGNLETGCRTPSIWKATVGKPKRDGV